MRGCGYFCVGLLLMVAGCSSGPKPSEPSRNPEQASQIYGPPLSEGEFRHLAIGNTLFRPLASGGTTVVYVAPDQQIRLRVQTADGRLGTDAGQETLSPDQVCWHWQRAGNQCFRYYWNGRLLTLEDVDNNLLPAQFLVKQGDSEKLQVR